MAQFHEANLPWHVPQLNLFSMSPCSFYLHQEDDPMLLLAWEMWWNLMRKKADIIMRGYQTSRVKETLQVNGTLTQN